MSITLCINGLSAVHRGSGGTAIASVPDVCNTPSLGGPTTPIPYPNVAVSADLAHGTQTITADGGQPIAIAGSQLARSTGDEPGTAGGVTSHTQLKEAIWLSYSLDVQFEGKGACRLGDALMMNHGNTLCSGGILQAPATPITSL